MERVYAESISNEEVSQIPIGAFSGKIVVIDRAEDVAPACHRLSMDPLIGFEALLGPDRKGVIEDFIDDSDNPLFLVRIGEKVIYVPAADDLIEEIDVETKRIVFDLPDGLIELND